MSEHTFSKSKALAFGWQTTLQNIPLLLGICLFILVCVIPPMFLANAIKDVYPGRAFLLNAFFWILQQFFTVGVLKMLLTFCDQQKPSFKQLFSGAGVVWSFILASILASIIGIVIMGLFLLPGLIWAVMTAGKSIGPILLAGISFVIGLCFVIYVSIRIQFFTLYIVERAVGPIESLRLSWAVTRQKVGALLVFSLLLALTNLAGLLVLGVGLLVTLPTTMLATAHVYRQLTTQDENKPLEVST